MFMMGFFSSKIHHVTQNILLVGLYKRISKNINQPILFVFY